MPDRPYDALLLVSFGGPEQPEDVVPFLGNVTRGRGIPPERLAEVGAHYFRFGGRSPINDQNRALLARLRAELDLPVYWGNRHWRPYLADALREMRDAGVRRALAFVTSAYASYAGCRSYREAIAAAQRVVGPGAPEVDKLRHYFNHPGFVDPFVRATRAALPQVPDGSPLVFTAHSVPLWMAETAGPTGGAYVRQLAETARLVAAAAAPERPWSLVFQSRSGPPTQPWLEPDVVDHLERLHAAGAPGALLVPVGFVSDHMEVVYDLDTQAAERAAELGLPLARAATPGTDDAVVAMVAGLVAERQAGGAAAGVDRPALGVLGPSHDVCPAGCCPAPAPRRTA